MGSQSSKVADTHSTFDEKTRYSLQARSDAASTAALLSRLNISPSERARRSEQLVSSNSHPPADVSLDAFSRWQNDFARDDKAQLASTLLSKQHIPSALVDRQALKADKQVFSHTLTVQP